MPLIVPTFAVYRDRLIRDYQGRSVFPNGSREGETLGSSFGDSCRGCCSPGDLEECVHAEDRHTLNSARALAVVTAAIVSGETL